MRVGTWAGVHVCGVRGNRMIAKSASQRQISTRTTQERRVQQWSRMTGAETCYCTDNNRHIQGAQ